MRERVTTELGTELRCGKCGELWPEDREFWTFNAGRAHSYCKACYAAYLATRRSRARNFTEGQRHIRLSEKSCA